MQNARKHSMTSWAIVALTMTVACSKEQPSTGAPPARSTGGEPSALAPPSAVPSVLASAPAPSATASATPHDCPKDSTGEGSFTKPCDAKGAVRMIEVAWTGKTEDKGPLFRVTNKSPTTILYGKIAVFFYDKAGKQLEAKDTATPPKGLPYHSCGGNIFGGVMKPAEKAVLTFSCVKKEAVPDGTAAIEAEMQMVGFADASEKKVEYYWRNTALTPDARPKGGVK